MASLACRYCDEDVLSTDKRAWPDLPVHYECAVRLVIGSAAHQLHECTCYGGKRDDPPCMTRRQSAQLAAEAFDALAPGQAAEAFSRAVEMAVAEFDGIEPLLPHYWQDEKNDSLRPVVIAYLGGDTMSTDNIACLRAYLRQWVSAPVWTKYIGDSLALSVLRMSIDEVTTAEHLRCWIKVAVDAGLDPF